MRTLFLALAIGLSGQLASAAEIDPTYTEFQWMNGPTPDARYELSSPSNMNKVHIFEVFGVSCDWCQLNAVQVKAMATEYADDARVQFIDLGLDTNERSYKTWINAHRPNYPVVQDAAHRVFTSLRTQNGIPQTFVVACNGKLIASTLGYWEEQDKAKLKEAIERAKQITCEPEE